MEKIKKNYYPFILVVIFFAIIIVGIYYFYQYNENNKMTQIDSSTGQTYTANIIKETNQNTYFRKVLFKWNRKSNFGWKRKSYLCG